MKSLEQDIAQTAYRHVVEIKKSSNSALEQSYGSLCHRFPQMVMLNGLRLTLAFLESKGKSNHIDESNAYGRYYQHLRVFLKPEEFDRASAYRYQTRIALRAALWYKRYAESILGITGAEEVEVGEQGGGTVNLRLELTKSLHKGGSLLMNAIKDGSAKASFYEGILKNFGAASEPTSSMWGAYSTFFKRYYQAIEQQPPSHVFSVQTQSPLLIGNGGQSVLETHLTLHQTYGIPYLPGTALKGMAASYCNRYVGNKEQKFRVGGSYYQMLFGSKEAAGSVIYYDALPVVDHLASLLKLDVLTPHHQQYNQNSTEAGGEAAPRDDDSPVPVLFLSVQGKFQLALGWNGGTGDTEADEWLEIAKVILMQALEHEGIGGKTNTGYGRFSLSD